MSGCTSGDCSHKKDHARLSGTRGGIPRGTPSGCGQTQDLLQEGNMNIYNSAGMLSGIVIINL